MSETEKAPQQQLSLQKIFLQDASYECPQGAEAFKEQWRPEVKLDINSSTRVLESNFHEVVLMLTITVAQDDKTAFLVEIKQGGVFQIEGIEGDELKRVLAAFCPSVLYPYARETVDSLVVKGGFPPLMLAPVNFDALFLQQQRKNAEQQNAEQKH